MAFSDVIQAHQTKEQEQTDAGSEKRVYLPKPDVNNITVLTESLPNEPILPWHHFDSPWLEKAVEQGSEEEDQSQTRAESTPNQEQAEQLALPLDGDDKQEQEPLEAASP
ncbi:MAG TPA: hypothetical protein IGR64_06575 [Leptolyngbyaceae cyanobacterium M65_K2018_010]|nr:hypothetical protein [Leptolyngbyaceae cyanobacterium M65_K2018_010]